MKNKVLLTTVALLFASSFPPQATGFLSFFTFVPLFFYLEGKPEKPFKDGFWCGFVATLFLLYWFYLTVGFGAIAAFPYLGIYWGAIFSFSKIIREKLPKIRYYFFPFLWCTVDALFDYGHLAFPWVRFGYSMSYYPAIVQTADLIGINGITFWLLLVNVFIFEVLKNYLEGTKLSQKFKLYSGLLLFPVFYGFLRPLTLEKCDETIRVGILQTNVDPFEKWYENRYEQLTEILKSYKELAPKCDVVITPETAMPFYVRSNELVFGQIKEFVNFYKTPFIVGAPDAPLKNSKEHYNSVLFIKPEKTEVYNKVKLVPFGERMPFADYFPNLKNIELGIGEGHFSRGTEVKIFSVKNFRNKEIKFSASICFESIFENFIAESVSKGSSFLINITNDAWFSTSHEQWQHSQVKIFRAIENRRSIVRVGNSGISMLVSPKGEVLYKSELGEKTNVVVEVPICTKENFTIFTKFGKYLNFAYLFVTLFIGVACIFQKKKP
ncbi:apolipoprotein N-acyltransferase [bacterium]|nr:apolipoprotein N-acyltransferase [bacterium]